MKTEFKAKFLQHVAKKRKEEGFTLIELLVVIIIIGILSAIALPSFLNQANKAKQSEAKTYIGSMNKAQQAFYAEKTTFSTDIVALGVGIKTQTTNYTYECTQSGLDGGVCHGQGINTAALRSYGGSVYLLTAGGDTTTTSLLCETTGPGEITAMDAGDDECGDDADLVE
ncbi:type IV pilin-like G/H family protein [Okeania sp. SIO1I7]|uniref:type IV pilin-like G/H family protein n=1 Tax=Okeania sp. SIO1I7 TaxID=2607772 RepID=UPI0013FC6435|nr:type IV pilin-like G/H family protein [Okeania sp. SIO1I7]NET28205.1 prepilin-type N-terminal cleavage/methylation domain-containing protein [Okeania sp. SIO1I7]